MQRDNRRDKIAAALAATGLPVHQLFFTWHRDFDAATPAYRIYAVTRGSHYTEYYTEYCVVLERVVWECDTLDECLAVRQEMQAIAMAAEKFMLSLPD